MNSPYTLNDCDVDAIVEIASDEELFEIHSKPGGLFEKASREDVRSAAKSLDRDGNFKAVRRLENRFPFYFVPLERGFLHEFDDYDS